MNWYKIANPSRVNDLSEISEYIKYISEIVFQTGRGASNMLNQIIKNKKLSSFKDVLEILEIALKLYIDNPRKFSKLCMQSARKLDFHIKNLGKKKTNKGLK